MSKGKQFISELKLYSDYLKWDDNENRFETWNEAVDKVLDTHRVKYGEKIDKYIGEVSEPYYNKEFLASQRSLQFRGDLIHRNNAKLYNCFGKETEFVTSEGVKRFENFRDGDITTVLTHKGNWKKATVKNYGKAALNKIKIGRNKGKYTYYATENHRWLLKDESITEDIKVGDQLIRTNRYFEGFDYDSANPLERLYWCYGLVYGDGTKIKNNGEHAYSMIRLCGYDKQFAKRFEEMGFKTSTNTSLEGDYMAYTGTYLKTAPDPAKDSPELIRAFVAGYLQADGAKNSNFEREGNYGSKFISLQTSDESHIDFVRKCFPIAGVFICGEKDYTGQETNFGIRGKTISFRLTQGQGNTAPYFSVKSIEDSGRYEDVWCLEVEDDKSFTFPNGLHTGNCCVSYAYSPDIFNKGFFVLLSGTGLGVSLKNKFVSKLPTIDKRGSEAKLHILEDSIEGWAESAKVLLSSFCKHPSLYGEFYGHQIKFDFSQIRPKGSFIRGGFRAPGHEGLKQSLERIDTLLSEYVGEDKSKVFKSIIAYDVFMHLSDAVLSGGVRRSAMNVIIDEDDTELLNAKTGNWRQAHPWRARSNNSVGLLRNNFSKDTFEKLVAFNNGDNDLGFVFMSNEDELFNPCYEIGFNFYSKIKNKDEAVFQFCNLTEINASSCKNATNDNFNEDKFYELCRVAAIVGTLQAGYSKFPYLGKQTEEIVAGEALLGVSITGWMTRPELFNEKILIKGAQVVKDTNAEVAKVIGINLSARATTVKPSGNASVVLQTASGIHPEHSKRYFRIMQLSKDSETAKWLLVNKPEMLENSVWSNTGSDYVVYSPCVNPEGTLYKDEMQGVKHLKLIELVQNSWVKGGKREELCYAPTTDHNVSNTVIIDDEKEIIDYIFDNQDTFTAVSFLSMSGDKDYNQAPFTSVLNTKEIIEKYGDGAMFMAGLIVDGLHYFDGDLWTATKHVVDKSLKVEGNRSQVLLKKDWIRRVKKFSINYFKKDMDSTLYCMKDVHLWHKWNTISKGFKMVDFTEILNKPEFVDVDTLGAVACSGSQCEVTFI